MKGWRTIYHSNGPQNKARVAFLISDKLKFIPNTVVRDEEGHDIILKGSIQQDNLTIMNIYALNVSELDDPIKRCRVSDWIKKSKTHLFAVYKRLILDVRTPTT